MPEQKIHELAAFGGRPLFEQPVHVGQPNLGDLHKFRARMDDILERRWLTNQGPYVAQFERRIEQFTGVRHCIAMCNGTVALEILLRALDFKGEVIVPALTFVATAHALQWQGIQPVFCDVLPETHNLDPAHLETLITERTTGILGVHLWGRPAPVAEIDEIAARHGLMVIYDAAHAFGAAHAGKMIGNFGLGEVFSFHATKFVHTFEGGAVVTNSDTLAEKIRLMKNFGFTGYDQVEHIGMNGKLPEVSAAMGLTNLDHMDAIVAANLNNYTQYSRQLADIPGITLIEFDASQKQNYQYIVCVIDPHRIGLTRDRLVAVLHAENVLARRYFYPGCHRMEPYRSQIGAPVSLPVTEQLCENLLILPTGTTVPEDSVKRICDLLRFVASESAAVAAALDSQEAARA